MRVRAIRAGVGHCCPTGYLYDTAVRVQLYGMRYILIQYSCTAVQLYVNGWSNLTGDSLETEEFLRPMLRPSVSRELILPQTQLVCNIYIINQPVDFYGTFVSMCIIYHVHVSKGTLKMGSVPLMYHGTNVSGPR